MYPNVGALWVNFERYSKLSATKNKEDRFGHYKVMVIVPEGLRFEKLCFSSFQTKSASMMADDLPPLDAPIVETPERYDLLDEHGMPKNDECEEKYFREKSWDVEEFVSREAVRKGRNRYTFQFEIKWMDTWHQEDMILKFDDYGWIPLEIDWDSGRFNERYQRMEYRCRWSKGKELFENLSPHSQRLVTEQFG